MGRMYKGLEKVVARAAWGSRSLGGIRAFQGCKYPVMGFRSRRVYVFPHVRRIYAFAYGVGEKGILEDW